MTDSSLTFDERIYLKAYLGEKGMIQNTDYPKVN